MSDADERYFGDSLQGLSEAAPLLAAKYNEIVRRYSMYQEITEEEMAELLQMHVDPKEFNEMMSTDFSQGVMIGKLLTLNDVSIFLDSEDADYDGED